MRDCYDNGIMSGIAVSYSQLPSDYQNRIKCSQFTKGNLTSQLQAYVEKPCHKELGKFLSSNYIVTTKLVHKTCYDKFCKLSLAHKLALSLVGTYLVVCLHKDIHVFLSPALT